MIDDQGCRVYWGSHGCQLERGHTGHHFCCCDCGDRHPWGERDVKCVGKFPFYGDLTRFYGEDVDASIREGDTE